MSADLHWAWTSLVFKFLAEALLCFFYPDFFFYFANFVFLRFSCCFAWFLASHAHSATSPNTIVPSLPHPRPPLHCDNHPDSSSPPTTAAPTPEQTAVSDRRGAWEVQPTRQANSSYLTSHLAADRHGGSVQVYTPHLISQHPFTQSLWSQICLIRLKDLIHFARSYFRAPCATCATSHCCHDYTCSHLFKENGPAASLIYETDLLPYSSSSPGWEMLFFCSAMCMSSGAAHPRWYKYGSA